MDLDQLFFRFETVELFVNFSELIYSFMPTLVFVTSCCKIFGSFFSLAWLTFAVCDYFIVISCLCRGFVVFSYEMCCICLR